MLAIGNFMEERNVFLSNQIVLEFCFGMFLAFAFYYYQLPISGVRYGWLVGFAMLCLAPLYVAHDSTNGLPPSVRWAAWGVPAFIVVASFLGFASTRSRWERLLVLIGDASYAIYLTHPFVMVAYARVLKDHPRLTTISQLPFVPLVFLICLVGGTATHMLIERPLIDLARRLLAMSAMFDFRRAPVVNRHSPTGLSEPAREL
jgi:exopolysaccharide production protein ExoZ